MSTPAVQALASQVGGHAGVMTTEDGSLLIKPATKRELEFYQVLQAAKDEALVTLRDHTPKFLGTLTLEGEATNAGEGGALEIKPAADRNESLVLENLSHKFSRPNIMDIKLGTVLYDEGASEDKVKRMIETAKNTTSFESGVRLTGFQVYDNRTGKAVNTPKTYGKSIKVSDLPDGIARFFPVSHDDVPEGEPSHGLPHATLLPMTLAIRKEIAQIREALSKLEFRMVGGSILVVYEAEWERADAAIKRHLAGPPTAAAEEEDEDEEESDDDDDEENAPPPAFTVKLIDFAHTRIEPGIGTDQGVLLGLDTVLRLLDGRIEDLKKLNVVS